ncbi:hypothetical protein FKM82_022878 [Ascaphus truei]
MWGLARVRITSSANREILYSFVEIEIPLMPLSCLILAANGSIVRANRSGDSGQPCLVPFLIEIGSDSPPEIFTYAVGFW